MKIISWNINGIRAYKTDLKDLFAILDGDVICFQETKVTRAFIFIVFLKSGYLDLI